MLLHTISLVLQDCTIVLACDLPPFCSMPVPTVPKSQTNRVPTTSAPTWSVTLYSRMSGFESTHGLVSDLYTDPAMLLSQSYLQTFEWTLASDLRIYFWQWASICSWLTTLLYLHNLLLGEYPLFARQHPGSPLHPGWAWIPIRELTEANRHPWPYVLFCFLFLPPGVRGWSSKGGHSRPSGSYLKYVTIAIFKSVCIKGNIMTTIIIFFWKTFVASLSLVLIHSF